MPASNEEKYLKSIDGTLKDILKELKRQGRNRATATINIDGKKLARTTLKEIDIERYKEAQLAIRGKDLIKG